MEFSHPKSFVKLGSAVREVICSKGLRASPKNYYGNTTPSMASSHHWRNVWRNIAGSRPNWAQDFTRTSQKNNRTSQKNYYEHSRNFWNFLFLAATKQLYEWFSPSVRPSVCPSVCPSVTPFWLCSYQRIIMKFSGVITKDKSDVHAKDGGQRSKVKVTEVTTQLNRFRTVTPVWIHIWWWNDAYSLMMLRRGALLFLKVIRQISRSHGSKKRRIWPRLGVSGL